MIVPGGDIFLLISINYMKKKQVVIYFIYKVINVRELR